MKFQPLSFLGKAFLSLLALVVVGALAIAAAVGWGIKYYNAPGETESPITVIIPKGTGVEQTALLLHESGVIAHPYAFAATAFLLNQSHQFKAGEYEFPAQASPKYVLSSLVEGKTVIHKLTVPEGLSTAQVLALVQTEEKLSGEVPADVQEGELLPETYYFSRDDDRAAIIARMKRDMRSTLMSLWETRQPDLPFRTPQEALALASIVEKETAIESEYTTVASVYINRLRIGMPLQADPTVIYAITQGKETLDRPLKYSDLRMESPYNTYVVNGLPPGPIANPGKKALAAALAPAQTDYLFFVADGKGGHNFSSNLSQHNAFVADFRKVMKERAKVFSPPPLKSQSPAAAAKAPSLPIVDEREVPTAADATASPLAETVTPAAAAALPAEATVANPPPPLPAVPATAPASEPAKKP